MTRRLSSPTFIGRVPELHRLREALARSTAGDPATVLVGGEAGVGKTRLVGEIVAAARGDGARVLIGHCVELGESGLPFAPVVEGLRELAHDLPPDSLAAVLAGGRADLARIVPDLALPGAESHAGSSAELDLYAQAKLFELILGTLGRLSSIAPVLLVLEDLHWADRSTRDLCRFLVRNLRDERLLIVGTFRSDELRRRHPLLPLLGELERVERSQRIDLARFGSDELAGQLSAILGSMAPAALVASIQARSDGNPFFAEELLAAEVEAGAASATGLSSGLSSGASGLSSAVVPAGSVPGPAALPASLEALLTARIARLSERAQELLRAAAIAGREAPHGLLARVSDLPPAELLEALREAVEQQVLVPGDDPRLPTYRFRHALVQEAVYADLLPTERSALHARVVDALLVDPGLAAGPRANRAAALAYHADRAIDLPRALRWSVEAGEAAIESFAFAEALGHLERAIELWSRIDDAPAITGQDRIDLLIRASEAAATSGELARAAALAREALAELSGTGRRDPVRFAIIHDRLFWSVFELGDLPGLAATIETAVAEMTADDPPGERARLLNDLAHARWSQARYAEGQRLAAAAGELAREAGNEREEAFALLMTGGSKAASGDLDRGIDLLYEARRRLVEHDVDMATFATVSIAGSCYWAGRHEEAVAVLLEELAAVRRRGAERRWGIFLVSGLWDSYTDLGCWEECDRQLAEVLFPDAENRATSWLRECIAELSVLRGDLERARAEIEATERMIGEGAAAIDRIFVLRSIAALARAEGRYDDVRRAVDEAIAQSDDLDHDAPLWWIFAHAVRSEADRAEVAAARGQGPELQDARAYGGRIAALLGRVAAEAERTDRLVPTLRAYRDQTVAEASRLDGRSDPDAWATTARSWHALGQPLDEAHSRMREAEALLADGRGRQAATVALREAHRTAVELGARPLVAETTDLARRARIELDRPPTGSTDLPAAEPAPRADLYRLTPREREVLVLLTAGRTNPQIGDALFISEKTASVHVSNIMGKLGATSRVEAATLALRAGLVEAPLDASEGTFGPS